MASEPTSSQGQSAPDRPARPSLEGRQSLGKYTIGRQLGAGGMGTVYLAVDTQLKRTVALKVLPRDRTENDVLVLRFEAEAQASAQLRHENIVTVYDAGRLDGFLYIALEYVEGTDIYELVVKRGPLPLKRSIEFLKQATRALEHLAQRGFVHRDIKPSNLLVTKDGTLKLTDMGLARAVDESFKSHITREGTTVGTVDYMSPEQARDSQAADIRSDIYSLGCTWYQMLTGEPPFPTGSVTNKLYSHISKPRPDPRALNGLVTEEVVAVMHRMMARKASDRHQTPVELLKDLEHLGKGTTRVDELLRSDADVDMSSTPTPAFGSNLPLPPRRVLRPAAEPAKPGSGIRVDGGSAPYKLPARQPLNPQARAEGPAAPPKTRERPPSNSDHGIGDAQRGTSDAQRDTSDAQRGTETIAGARTAPGRSAPTPVKGQRSVSKSAARRAAVVSDLPTATATGKSARPEEPSVSSIDWKPLAVKLGAAVLAIAAVGTLGWFIFAPGDGIHRSDDGAGANPFARELPGIEPGAAKAAATAASTRKVDVKAPKKSEPKARVVGKADDHNRRSGGSQVVGRPEERAKFPGWIPDVWDPKIDPAETAFAKVTTLTVGRNGKEAADCVSLAAAIAKLPADGGIIELHGRGPFLLTTQQIAKRRQVVITGIGPRGATAKGENDPPTSAASDKPNSAPDNRPLVALVPGSSSGSDIGISAVDTSLTLYGIHLAAFADQFPGDNAVRLIHVQSGDLTVRDSSLTLIGARTGPTIGFALSGANADHAPRILLDRVVVRGNDLTAIEGKTSAIDFLAIGSLFATGKAPLMNLLAESATKPVPSDPAALNASEGPARLLRFFSCTASSSDAAFLLHPAPDVSHTPTTRFLVMNSIFGASEPLRSSMVVLDNWPVRPPAGDSHSRVENLRWETKAFYVRGWQSLVQADGASAFGTKDGGDWTAFWGIPGSTFDYQLTALPSPSDLATALPSAFKSESLVTLPVATGDTALPGCDVAQLAVAPQEIVARAEAFAKRPAVPSEFLEGALPGATIKNVTLDNPDRRDWEDLARIINQSGWASGTRFVIRGAGNKVCSPIHVDGRSLCIEFEGEPPQLTFEDQKRDSAGGHRAYISVTGGTLELVHANFRVAQSTKQSPAWLIDVKDGSLSIRDSTIIGPPRDNPGYKGLIHVSSSGPAAGRPGESAWWGHIRNSYLCTGRTLMDVDLASRNVTVENSILAAVDRVFNVRISAASPQPPVMNLQASTLAAGAAYFHFDSAAEGPANRIRVFAEDTVFGPPMGGRGRESGNSALISGIPDAAIPSRLDWWDYACGYSHLIGLPRATADAVDALGGWQQLAGASHIVRSIADANAVIFPHDLPQPKEANFADFRLKEDAHAATWTDVGGPLGAKPSSEPSPLRESVTRRAPAPKKPTVPKPAIPKPAAGGGL